MQKARSLREKLNAVKGIEVFGGEHLGDDGAYDYDPLMVVVAVRGTGLSGYEAAGLLAGPPGKARVCGRQEAGGGAAGFADVVVPGYNVGKGMRRRETYC